MLNNLQDSAKEEVAEALKRVQEKAITTGNLFEELMEVCKIASLGQITDAMFQVGGQYRRNM
jgi:methylmalonyl-CoA mutase